MVKNAGVFEVDAVCEFKAGCLTANSYKFQQRKQKQEVDCAIDKGSSCTHQVPMATVSTAEPRTMAVRPVTPLFIFLTEFT